MTIARLALDIVPHQGDGSPVPLILYDTDPPGTGPDLLRLVQQTGTAVDEWNHHSYRRPRVWHCPALEGRVQFRQRENDVVVTLLAGAHALCRDAVIRPADPVWYLWRAAFEAERYALVMSVHFPSPAEWAPRVGAPILLVTNLTYQEHGSLDEIQRRAAELAGELPRYLNARP